MGWNSFQENDEVVSEGGLSTIFRDVLMNQVGAFFAIACIFMALINKPGEEASTGAALPGNIVVESFWPDTVNADVDQIVRGPEGPPVLYSNLVGVHYNLLRDDLGKVKDDPVNYEVTYSRGIPHGEHCVNLHLYSNKSNYYPVAVKVNVTVSKGEPGKSSGKSKPSSILTTDLTLDAEGQEKNVFCFFIDRAGGIIEGQTYSSQSIKLRSPQVFGP